MSKGIANAFRVPELRGKILLTVLILLLYRFGAYLPVPGAPFQQMLSVYQNGLAKNGAMAVLNLFSGGALSRMSVFSLGIMPYITAQIIFQMSLLKMVRAASVRLRSTRVILRLA